MENNEMKLPEPLKLDGVSNYISIKDSKNWFLAKKDFTIEFGIKFKNQKQAQKFWKQLNKFLKEVS